MDGIDIALVRTDGADIVERGPSASYSYPADFREKLAQANAIAARLSDHAKLPDALRQVEQELTDRHAKAIEAFATSHNIALSALDVIGFHGQTVLHRPQAAFSVQLGDGHRLANHLGIDVVYDFRAADLAAGGQGAPFAPIYHRALAADLRDRPIAFLNVGGVANITWIGVDEHMLAFDCGPGNAMIDDWVQAKSRRTRDENGALALAGVVDDVALAILLNNDWFAAAPPKALDRDAFSSAPAAHLSLEDGAATFTAFTAATVAGGVQHMPAPPEMWVVCGGGRHNDAIMKELRARLSGQVVSAEAIDCDGDAIEAEAFAYMAVRSIAGLPLSFPDTTGAPSPQTGGILARARSNISPG